MKTAKDWYALAQEILPLAKAGDPEAQYVLFDTYRKCYQYHDKRAPNSENAARESATAIGLSADDAAMWFGRCHRLVTDDVKSLGDPWNWLQQATDAGYPMAQATTANQRLSQDQAKAFVRAGGQPDDPTVSLPPIGGDTDPRELLVLAAQSADPEVLGEIGDLQHTLNPTQPRDVTNITTAAWMYVGCQRDCSGFGQPTTVINCGPNDGNCVGVPDWLLKLVDYNWAPVQEKVNQINAALNSKQWDQLPGLIAAGG
jgi:hypothetical protein